jgi:hypothetical protein
MFYGYFSYFFLIYFFFTRYCRQLIQGLKYGVPHQLAVLGPEKSQIERVGAHTE